MDVPAKDGVLRIQAPESTEHGPMTTRTFKGEIVVRPPATRNGALGWLLTQSCPDLKGHAVLITEFSLTHKD